MVALCMLPLRLVAVGSMMIAGCQAVVSDADSDRAALLSLMRVRMQPVVVAKLLSQVEGRWERDAIAELRDELSGAQALSETEASCQKVTKSIIAGAAGNKERVTEYMKEVCLSDKDPHAKLSCEKYSAGVMATMTEDAYHNREELNLVPFCKKLYVMFLQEHAKEERQRQQVEADKAAKQEESDRLTQEAAQLHTDANEALDKLAAAEKNAEDAQQLEASMGADAEEATKAAKLAEKKYQVADEREVAEAEAAALRTAEAARKSRVIRVAKVVKAAKAKKAAKKKAHADAQQQVLSAKRATMPTPLRAVNQVAVEEDEVEDEASDKEMMGNGPLIIGFSQSSHTSGRGLPQTFFLQQ